MDQSSRDKKPPKNSERIAGLQLGARYVAEGSAEENGHGYREKGFLGGWTPVRSRGLSLSGAFGKGPLLNEKEASKVALNVWLTQSYFLASA